MCFQRKIFEFYKFEFVSDFDIRVSDLVPAMPGWVNKMNTITQSHLKIEKVINSLAPQQLEEAINFLNFLDSRNLNKAQKKSNPRKILGKYRNSLHSADEFSKMKSAEKSLEV